MTNALTKETIQVEKLDPWRGFVGEDWKGRVAVREFIQANYTEYRGNKDFLAGPTEKTQRQWAVMCDLLKQERKNGGVLAVSTDVGSSITSHGAGYISRENEVIVGLQTDAPLRRAIYPKGGMRMVEQSLEEYGFPPVPDHITDVFANYRKSHNEGVFDIYDPEILAWRTGPESRFTAGDAWHHDVSCDATPIWGSFLHVTHLPQCGGGDTAFANMVLAYESLSEPYQRLLDGLSAVHDGARAWTAGYGSQPEPGKTFPASEHPVVARHPHSGAKFLFVNEAFTSHIVQLTRSESTAVLEHLYRHIERQLAFQVRVHWEPGTLLFWDNWATQHHAVWDYFPQERWGERVSVLLPHGPQA